MNSNRIHDRGKNFSFLLKAFRIALVLIISLIVAGVLIKTRPRPQQKLMSNPGPLVEVVEAHRNSSRMIVQGYGTVQSGENLDLTTEVKGKIVEMAQDFEEGAYFKSGSFLMRIDPRNYRLTLERLHTELGRLDGEFNRIRQERDNLRATLKIAREALSLTKGEYDRNLSLGERRVVSQNQLDQSRQGWLVSRQNVQEIQNAAALIGPRMTLIQAQRKSVLVQVKEAQLALDRTEILAPFDCRVAKKWVEKGQYVISGGRLASIYNVGIMEVVVRIPPRDVIWLHFDMGKGLSLTENPASSARITFDTPGERLKWLGYISGIKGKMEERTRTLPVVVRIKNSHPGGKNSIIPGMFVKVEILGRMVTDLFILPEEAIHENGTVYVVNNGRLRIKSVDVLRRKGTRVFVKGGLSDGDQVITLFPGSASEGMKVRISKAPSTQGDNE